MFNHRAIWRSQWSSGKDALRCKNGPETDLKKNFFCTCETPPGISFSIAETSHGTSCMSPVTNQLRTGSEQLSFEKEFMLT